MQYVVMHKADAAHEAGTKPPTEVIENMGRLIGETIHNGQLLLGAGLHASSRRLRVVARGGRCEVQAGPYPGRNELPAAIVAIRVGDRDEAIEWAKRYANALGGDAEVELGPQVEPWDLGKMKRPEGKVPARFLIVQKADAATESGKVPPAVRKALAALLAAMAEQGVLEFAETLAPSSQSKRLLYRDHRRTVVDGPFAESKELIGGFCKLQMRSLDEVVEWTDRYARILGGNVEVDLRPVGEPIAAANAR